MNASRCAYAALLLAGCASSTTSTRSAIEGTQPLATLPATDEHLSEVARPDDVMAVLRVAPVNALAKHVGRLFGLATAGERLVNEIFHNTLSEPSLAEIADRDSPLDVAWVLDNNNEVVPVIAFSVPPLDTVEAALSNTWVVRPLDHGMLLFEPASAHDSNEHESPRPHMRCVGAPTPQPTASTMVCAERWQGTGMTALTMVAPYMSRTLTRHVLPGDVITLELNVDAARRHFAGSADAQIDTWAISVDRWLKQVVGPAILTPAANAATGHIVHDWLTNVHSLLNDARGLRSQMTFASHSLNWVTTVEFAPHPSGSIIAGLATAMHRQPNTPLAGLTPLLPDALFYANANIDEHAFERILDPLFSLGRLSLSESSLPIPQDDRTALYEALRSWLAPSRAQQTIAVGVDAAGDPWTVGWKLDPDETAIAHIQRLRALHEVLQRPSIRRAIDAANGNDSIPHGTRLLDTTGLPEGTLGLAWPRVRPHAAPAPATRPRRGTRTQTGPRVAETQLLLIPNDHQILYVGGSNARALYERAQQSNEIPQTAHDLGFGEHPVGIAFVLAQLPNLMRREAPADARALEQALQLLPDHGQTPIYLSVGSEQSEQSTNFTFQLIVDEHTLSGIPALVFGIRPLPTPPPPGPTP